MRQLLPMGMIAINTFAILSIPTTLRAEDSRSCTTALFKVQNQLSANRGVETSMRILDVSKTYPSYPNGRPMKYVFLLRGSAAESVMKSSQLLKSTAIDVIQNCNSVGMVSFAIWASGWSHSVGIMPGGKFDFFECIEPDRSRPTQIVWGQQYCT